MQKAIKRYFPVFVLPTLIAFTIGFLAPFVLGVYLSFCKFTTVTDAKFIGLSNYVKILGDGDFLHSLWFTALFTIVTVLLINIFAFAVAMLLTKNIKGTNIFRTVFFMPNLIGGIVLGYVWQLLLNGILAHFQKTLTYSSKYGFWGLVILMLWQQVGYMMIIYISGIQNIPGELIEAAEIDGANFWQRLRYVTLPMLTGSIMINLVFGITYGLKVFDIVYVLTNGGPGHATEVLTTYAFQLYSRGQYGMSSALNSILLLITAIAGVVIVKTLGKQEVQQ